MKPKKRLLSLLLCVTMLFSLCPQSVSAEGSTGTACTHEHTDDCYMEVTECVHEHDENCYPKTEDSVSENDATPSNATQREPDNCTHICTEESGCVTKTLNCPHEHDEDGASSPETAAPAEGTEGDDTIQTATDSNGDYEINADTLATEKVKAMIDALPDVSELKDMDNDELSEVHEKAQNAYDAFEALTEEQQAELTEELAKLRDVLDFMANLTATTAFTTTDQGYTFTLTKLTSDYGASIDQITDVSSISLSRNGNAVTGSIRTKGYSAIFNFSFNEDTCTNALSRNVTTAKTTNGAQLTMTITRGAKAHTGSATCSAKATCTTCGTSYTAAHEYGDYQNDGTNHWKACKSCGNITDKAACSGGTATCTVKATCSTCGNQYGSFKNHDFSRWVYAAYDSTKGEYIHDLLCANCNTRKHSDYCSYDGTPNCSQSVSCTKCGHVKTAPNNHDWGEWKSTGNGTHTHTCSRNSSHTETVACSGGTATCTDKAVCTTCKTAYGSVDTDNHNWSDWTSNNGTHTRTCSYNSSHKDSGNCSGGTATCESAAICSTCQQEYAPKKEHNYTYAADDTANTITESCDRGCGHSATVTLSAPNDLTYDGKAKEAVVTGSFTNVTTLTVTYDTEDGKAPKKVGSYTATIFVNDVSVSVKFSIAKKSTTATVTVNGTYTYTGEQIKPTNVTVKDGDGNTIDEKEYTLSYGENISAGTGTVTATFDENGSYTISGNSATGTFTIDPKPLTGAMISVTGSFTYDGDTKSPTVTVKDGEKTLVLDTDYTISGESDGTAAKTYTLTVSGKGNYSGSVGKNWTIGNATLTGISVEQDGKLTYTGTPQEPQVKTTKPDSLNVQFTYCDTENGTYGSMPTFTNAGTYTVYYKADAANYETYSGYFNVTIDRKPVTPDITVASGNTYTGTALTPAVTVKDGGTTIPDSEYEVSYSNNVEVGTATVTVTDKANGNYAITTATQTFEIAKASMSDKNTTGSAPYGASGEVDLTDLIEHGGKLEITDTTDKDGVLNGVASLDGSALKFAFQDDSMLIGKSASITVTVKDCKNYEDYKIHVTLEVTDKQAPTVTATAITQTYSGAALKDAVITGETGGVVGKWSWKDGNTPKDVADSTSNGKTWKVVFTPTDTAKYKAVETTVNVTIKPQGVTISGLSVENKTYDGTTTAKVTGTAVISGKFGNDDVTVQNGTAAFADKTAGTGKTVNFSGYGLTGADAGNYTLTAQPTATADISRKSVTVSGVTATDRDYKENDRTVVISGGTVNNVETGDDVSVDLTSATGTMENADASDKAKSVTVSGVKLTGTDAGNYVLSAQPTGVTVNISKIAYTGATTATGSAKYGSSNSVDLSSLIMSGGTATAGTASDSNGVLNTYAIENDTSLKFSFVKTAAVNDTATVTVHVSNCTNYNGYTLTVTLTVSEKDVPVVKAPTAKSLTYNGKQQTLITAGSTTGGTLQYSLDNSTWSAELPKAKDADKYTVYYKVVGNADYADTAVNSIFVTIGKKAVTVKPQSYTITQGTAIPTFALEYVGLVDGDTLNITAAPAFTCYEADGTTAVSTSTAAGKYTITWTNSDAFNFDNETNYTVTKAATGTLTINAKPNTDNGNGGNGGNGGNSGGSSDSGKDDITYYTLTFETNGGSSIKAVNTTYGKTIDLSGYIPTRSGYDFSGWYSDKGLTNKITKIKLNGNKTVYAGWVIHNPNTGVSNPFTDVSKNDWFYDHVMFVYGNNLMTGTSATTFEPNISTTRAQIAVIFYRMDGSPAVKGKNNFTDVEYGPGTAWYYDAATWAQQSGIMSGYGDNKFGPNDPVTREQLATIFYRYAQYKGYDTTQGGMAIREFDDYESISAYAMDAMTWAVNVGIMTGKGNNRLDPQGTATRAEIAAMLHRFIEKYNLTPAPIAPTTGSGGNSGGTSGWVQRTGSPKTGDNTNMGLWLFTLCASAGTLTVLLFFRRREEEERMITA